MSGTFAYMYEQTRAMKADSRVASKQGGTTRNIDHVSSLNVVTVNGTT